MGFNHHGTKGSRWEMEAGCWGVFSKSFCQILLLLAPGFSPVISRRPVVPAASAALVPAKKPLKRLGSARQTHTGLKPGASEIAVLQGNDILKTRPKCGMRGWGLPPGWKHRLYGRQDACRYNIKKSALAGQGRRKEGCVLISKSRWGERPREPS